MKDISVARVRRLLAYHVVILLIPILFLLALKGGSSFWDSTLLKVSAGFVLALALWLTVDLLLLFHYKQVVDRANPEMRKHNLSGLYFRIGVTWGEMRRFALSASQVLAYLEQEARPFPSTHKEIERVLCADGVEKAIDFVERLKREAAAAAKAAEKKKKYDAEQARIAASLLREGVALGLQQIVMETALREGLDSARAIIAKKRLKDRLMERAAQTFCVDGVRALIMAGHFDEAEAVITRAAAVINRGTAVGVGAMVSLQLRKGDLQGAEETIAEAERKVEAAQVFARMEERIAKLKESDRPAAKAVLAQLRRAEYSSRLYRKTLYELEKLVGNGD